MAKKSRYEYGTHVIFGQKNNSMFLPNTGLNMKNMFHYQFNTGSFQKYENDKILNNDDDLDLTD